MWELIKLLFLPYWATWYLWLVWQEWWLWRDTFVLLVFSMVILIQLPSDNFWGGNWSLHEEYVCVCLHVPVCGVCVCEWVMASCCWALPDKWLSLPVLICTRLAQFIHCVPVALSSEIFLLICWALSHPRTPLCQPTCHLPGYHLAPSL